MTKKGGEIIMSDYFITEVSTSASDTNEQIVTLLETEGMHKDKKS